MKTPPIVCAMSLAFLSLFLYINQAAAQSKGFTFQVCEVKPADTLLAEHPYRDAMTFYVDTKNEIAELNFYSENRKAKKPAPARLEAYGQAKGKLVASAGVNPFVRAVQMSYAEHRPLSISPDMIWLLIAQGFAAHVDANADSLRHLFVIHEGRKVLNVQRDDYVRGDSLFPWPEVFVSLRDQIDANTNAQLAELITPTFSTTGFAEKAAYEVTLMDAMSKYFVFAVTAMCGIPEITLEGTPEDWAALEERAGRLDAYGLDWWLDELKPILHEFTLAAQGKPNTVFWQDMFKLTEVDAVCTTVDVVNGWILQFFPYVDEAPNPWVSQPDKVLAYRQAMDEAMMLRKDPEIQKQLEKEPKTEKQFQEKKALLNKVYPEAYAYGLRALELSDFPLGISNADLLINDNGILRGYEMCAGFVGVGQDAATKHLRPEINWFVVDKNTAPPAEDAKLYKKWLESRKDSASKD